ncbi:MAG: tryptophanase [Halodesulfurarchaeum sp.]
MRTYVSKMVEPVELPPRAERETVLREAGYNVFNIDAEDVFVDLLTDSGTGTMSADQWAAMIAGDEAYAGSRSFRKLEAAVSDVMGFDTVVPAHQGRGAENVLYGALIEEGDVVLNNTHFDTTRAHVVANGGTPVDCPVPGAMDPDDPGDFKGNFDVERGRDVAEEVGAERIPVVIVTITNNSAAGQPVSTANLEAVRTLAEDLDATLVIDACRFAENAYFVRERERGYEDRSIRDIAKEQLSHADAVVMSAKKDGIANIGGFVAVRDESLEERIKQRAILYEGFSTYGGLAGRDLEAIAVGLREATAYEYVDARIRQTTELADLLESAGLPVYRPVGGHAVYVDAAATLPHVPAEYFPGQALVVELYREGAVRAVELGSFAFPDTDRPELVRLALPRRRYHREHLEFVAETASTVAEREADVPGYEVIDEPPMKELRHFSAELSPVEPTAFEEEPASLD